MSWSIQLVGTPEKIAAALPKEAEKQTGESRRELEAALPFLIGLVGQNFRHDGADPQALSLAASGHGHSAEDDRRSYRICSVHLETLQAKAAV